MQHMIITENTVKQVTKRTIGLQKIKKNEQTACLIYEKLPIHGTTLDDFRKKD